MPEDVKTEWDLRDELAAAFMQAIITGRYAGGRDPAVEAKAAARAAYDMASEFLEVRSEREDEESPEGDTSEP